MGFAVKVEQWIRFIGKRNFRVHGSNKKPQ